MLVLDVGGVPKNRRQLPPLIMHVIHTAYDEDGDVLEVSESIWPADRNHVVPRQRWTSTQRRTTDTSRILQALDDEGRAAGTAERLETLR
jgi:hypothetical protein